MPNGNVTAEGVMTVKGNVYVNGVATNGITVNCDCPDLSSNSSYVTNDPGSNPGYYQFPVQVNAVYTISASYNGHTTSQSFRANPAVQVIDLHIDYSTNTVANQYSDGSWSYSNPVIGGSSNSTEATPTVVTSVAPSVAPVVAPSLDPVTPSVFDTPTPSATATPKPSPFVGMEGIGVIILGAGLYMLIGKKRN